ncbi:hypothetical protein NPIL_356301 [Nephila pilipes]|uniref:Uncharacterized protein n=1 Tax=Nephila pilipes TaxID=299642 RepID=A0A8X6UHB1_NEPPI|nr:hypothetical protein NPIL_356301 [Nephila pilipes]
MGGLGKRVVWAWIYCGFKGATPLLLRMAARDIYCEVNRVATIATTFYSTSKTSRLESMLLKRQNVLISSRSAALFPVVKAKGHHNLCVVFSHRVKGGNHEHWKINDL